MGKRIKDLSRAETDGYLAVDNATNGTGKMNTSVIFNNFAGKFVPNSTNAVKGWLYAYDGVLYKAKEDYAGVWDSSKFEVYSVNKKLVDLNEKFSESFYVSVKGTGSQIHYYVQRPIKKGSKIIFSSVSWNPPSSGYPIRFDAYKSDGASYQMGFNYEAVGAMSSSGVYILTATDDAEYLDLRLTATNGSSNSFILGFDEEFINVENNLSVKIDGAISTGYATANRTKMKLKLQKGRMYDLSFSSSFSSAILTSLNLLIGIYVYSGDTYRRILSLNNTGASVPLHNYIYFNDDEDYVFVDMALDVGSSVTFGVTDVTEKVVQLDPQFFKQASISFHTDGSEPVFGYQYGVAGRASSQPAFLFPLVENCIITSKRNNLGYRVLYFAENGTQTSDYADATKIIVPNDRNCIIGIKSPSDSEFGVEQLVNETLVLCPSVAAKNSIEEKVSALKNLVNEQKKFYDMEAINHRGYNRVAPENTLPAFRLSAVHNFDAVETDLRESSDGYFVLCHDETVDRTSNGTGNVADKTLEQLKALDFGSWKSAEYAGTKIPTLAEALDCCYNLGINLVIEIKYSITYAKVKEMLALIEEKRMTRRVEFISFDVVVLRTLAMFNNAIHLGFLNSNESINDTMKDRLRMFENGVRQVSAVWESNVVLPSADIEWLKGNGFGLERYAPNTDEAVLAVADTADGIISDEINAREFLKEYEIEQ